MAIQCLVGEEQNFVTDPMIHGQPMQFSQHRANMVKLVPFINIILAALFWQHCNRSMWDCFAPYNRLLQESRRDVVVALILFSAVGPSSYFRIFPTEYRLKLILLHNLAMCASRQHGESNITPEFRGGSSIGEID